MSWKSLYWLLVCLCCFMSPVKAQTLHVISVADIHDFDLGGWFDVNSEHVQTSAKLFASAAEMKLNFKKVTSPDPNTIACSAILNAVKSLQAGSDDVILFYYSGHGFRPEHERESKVIFPWFVCDSFPPVGKTPNLVDINAALLEKKARLTITIADACNNFLQEAPLTPRMAQPPIHSERIKTMFRKFRGNLIMSGSKPGQFSYYFTTGGYFTQQLMNALQRPQDVASAKLWEAAVNSATEQILVRLPSGPEAQNPQALAKVIYSGP